MLKPEAKQDMSDGNPVGSQESGQRGLLGPSDVVSVPLGEVAPSSPVVGAKKPSTRGGHAMGRFLAANRAKEEGLSVVQSPDDTVTESLVVPVQPAGAEGGKTVTSEVPPGFARYSEPFDWAKKEKTTNPIAGSEITVPATESAELKPSGLVDTSGNPLTSENIPASDDQMRENHARTVLRDLMKNKEWRKKLGLTDVSPSLLKADSQLQKYYEEKTLRAIMNNEEWRKKLGLPDVSSSLLKTDSQLQKYYEGETLRALGRNWEETLRRHREDKKEAAPPPESASDRMKRMLEISGSKVLPGIKRLDDAVEQARLRAAQEAATESEAKRIKFDRGQFQDEFIKTGTFDRKGAAAEFKAKYNPYAKEEKADAEADQKIADQRRKEAAEQAELRAAKAAAAEKILSGIKRLDKIQSELRAAQETAATAAAAQLQLESEEFEQPKPVTVISTSSEGKEEPRTLGREAAMPGPEVVGHEETVGPKETEYLPPKGLIKHVFYYLQGLHNRWKMRNFEKYMKEYGNTKD